MEEEVSYLLAKTEMNLLELLIHSDFDPVSAAEAVISSCLRPALGSLFLAVPAIRWSTTAIASSIRSTKHMGNFSLNIKPMSRKEFKKYNVLFLELSTA